MLCSSRRILQSSVVSLGIESSSLKTTQCVQFVRGVRSRKPLYSGIAKSKVFIVPPRRRENVPRSELAEIQRLKNNYTCMMKSIRKFCADENALHEAGSKIAEQEIAAEEASWHVSLEEIKDWNASIAVTREATRAEARRQREIEVQNTIKEQEEQQLRLLQEAEVLLRREKELSKTYITEDNIDEAIQKALADLQDFNFSIDFKGQIYKGRFTKPFEVLAPKSDDNVLPPLSPLDADPTEDSRV